MLRAREPRSESRGALLSRVLDSGISDGKERVAGLDGCMGGLDGWNEVAFWMICVLLSYPGVFFLNHLDFFVRTLQSEMLITLITLTENTFMMLLFSFRPEPRNLAAPGSCWI